MTYHPCPTCDHVHAEKAHIIHTYRVVLHMQGTDEGVTQLLNDVASTMEDYGLGENAITSYRFEVEGGDRDVSLPDVVSERVKVAKVLGDHPPKA